MVVEKPGIERKQGVTPKIKGERAAEKGSAYFNPYSKYTQKRYYMEYESGYSDRMTEKQIGNQMPDNKFPHLLVLALGIGMVALVYYVFN